MRIDTAAMSSGTKARNDAKTKSSTASAPVAPNSVSTSTLGPSVSPPADSRSYDVSPTSMPAGGRGLLQGGQQLLLEPGPEARRRRSLDQREGRCARRR